MWSFDMCQIILSTSTFNKGQTDSVTLPCNVLPMAVSGNVVHACHPDAGVGNECIFLQETYGEKDAQKWWVRWRLFYMACSELFNYNKGDEWGVTHLVLGKRK